MSKKVWDVMGSMGGFTLLRETLGNIREVAPTTAFERGDAIELVYNGPCSNTGGDAQAFTSGVGSLTDKKA